MTVSRNRRLIALVIGIVSGALATHLIHLTVHHPSADKPPDEPSADRDPQLKISAANLGVEKRLKSADIEHPRCPTVSPGSESSRINIAEELFKRVRILCLIMTYPKNYATKAVAVNNTWARRCNRYVFFGSPRAKSNIPFVSLGVKESRRNLWRKTWMSFDYAEKHFNFDDFDFVLKADDDAYLVMENLRYLLLPLDPDESTLIGRVFQPDKSLPELYTSGGAGYLLSRQAAKTFVRKAVRNKQRGGGPCDLQSKWGEDYNMGRCIGLLGAHIMDSRDSVGLERFHPLTLGYALGLRRMPRWLHDFTYHKLRSCVKGCASRISVSFHYVSEDEMYKLEFLLYELRPIGIDPIAVHANVAMEALKWRMGLLSNE